MYIFCFRYIITHNETTSYDITHNQQALQIGSFKKGKNIAYYHPRYYWYI